ncbi:Mismatch repair protein msh3 [Malassezia caprae]|uniref:DNA mismatch repair protein MSH3 n=1 Tax=Malassezia caprae TaxID=1381934 RepID=A0AAF0EA18_9BASI|nr:Mismatch repair protein msh3 [Malassezia caprae]
MSGPAQPTLRAFFAQAGAGATQSSEKPIKSAETSDAGRRPPKRARTSAHTSSTPTYTPLETQILELKRAHPGMVLLIEVGYKFKFYGEDAHLASQALNIACFREKNLDAAMIPVPRMPVHVKRLLALGHKVGVCRQTETRALKAATENAHQPFARALTNVYTASTWIDDVAAPDASDEQVLVALVESDAPNAAHRHLGLVAVDMASSSATYDAFDDDALLASLETRLAHLAPKEIVLAANLGERTQRFVRHWAGPHRRVEEAIVCEAPMPGLAEHLHGEALAWAAELPLLVQRALLLLLTHLCDFQLASALTCPANFATFTERSSMLLSGPTLAHLEVLQNATDGTPSGSLLWLLDECATAMGRRLLRQWVRRPLLDAAQIAARAHAVDIMRERRQPVLHRAVALLTHLPDVARGLVRITHGLVDPSELVTILLAFHRVTHEFSELPPTGSALLDEALLDLGTARDTVAPFVDALDLVRARKNDLPHLYKDPARYPAIQDMQATLQADDEALHAHLLDLRRTLHRPALQYTQVSGIDHLIEVRRAEAAHIPADWLRISATQRVVRFHTPTIVQLQKQRERHRESLAAIALASFRDFVARVAEAYVPLRRVAQALGVLDVITSLARVASRPGYVRPTVHAPGEGPGAQQLHLTQFRHPMSEARLAHAYVPNDLALGRTGAIDHAPRGVLLTGSNMGGKSSTVRAIALIVILAQIGAFVPCRAAQLTCFDAIATRMGAHDDVLHGKSTFMVEAEDTARILRMATERTLVVLDEFGRGTSTFDGVALADAVLRSLLERGARMPMLLFITHYLPLTRWAHVHPEHLCNMHMAVRVADRGDESLDAADVVFLHRLVPGAASHSFGVHMAALAGLPPAVTARARSIAAHTQTTHTRAERRRISAQFLQAARSGHVQTAWDLVNQMSVL